jgi:hypothetical protein
MAMKTCVFLLLISAFLISGCEKEKYKSTGIITGYDYRKCYSPCCGGYLIDIGGNQYHFEKADLPDEFKFNDEKLPLSVELDWNPGIVVCSTTKWITITKIRALK